MVTLVKSTQELINLRKTQKTEIGYVPTMGNLHDGHISLLNEALKNSPIVYFSIFVNPKQFGPTEDFNKYPRTLEDDLKKIEEALKNFPEKGVIVFAPATNEEIFGQGHNETVSVVGLSEMLEGKLRPGHFDGVSTVVYRLFEIIRPHKSYFGLKDFQQYLLIKKMVSDLGLPVDVIGMPIIRETSGLAMSSRNQFLTPEEKNQALVLNEALQSLKKIIAGKKENIEKAKDTIKEFLKDKNWNYLEIRDAETLSVDVESSHQLTLLGVYQLRTTRLLDNMQVELK
jgi:pantoate--beta-alanine ligase